MDARSTLQARKERLETQIKKFGKPYGRDAQEIYQEMCWNLQLITEALAELDGALPNDHK